MLQIHGGCKEHFKATVAHAKRLGGESLESLKHSLSWLSGGCGNHQNKARVVRLYNDHAPYSFYFEVFQRDHLTGEVEKRRWYNGGIICHAPHSSGVGFPELSVTLSPQRHTNWQIHT